MRTRLRAVPIAVVALAAGIPAAPTQAAPVIEVDGSHAVRVDDPFVPSRAEIELPPTRRGADGAAGSVSASASASASATQATRRRVAGARPARAVGTVLRALRAARRAGAIEAADRVRYVRDYRRARRVLRRLSGARRTQLAYVLASVERLALTGKLIPTRMPVAFLQLRRNTQYWRSLPYPGTGDQVSFRGSQILFQYFPGEGLQLHPLSTFKKANLLHGACVREEAACDPDAIRVLLDEMAGLATDRGRGVIAWEYMFHFGGGAPPWISGMASATAVQALARASELLAEPRYAELAATAIGMFKARAPIGVRTRGPRGGIHYLQYSFAPRLYIFNAFVQTLIGLHDYNEITGDRKALIYYRKAEPEARREIPYSDVGDWSRYSYAGAESTHEYHELLRELLASMCSRRLGDLYCDYAERYLSYQTDPPELLLTGPVTGTSKQPTAIRFSVDKLSAVEVKVYKGSKQVLYRLATFRKGNGSFAWRPLSPGLYRVQIAAKELRTGRGLKDRASGDVQVAPAV